MALDDLVPGQRQNSMKASFIRNQSDNNVPTEDYHLMVFFDSW